MKKAEYQLYYVGGYVRDKYLKLKRNGDIDFATNAKPDELMRLADENGIKARIVGRSFPVVLFHIDGVDYEVATYRMDGDYSNHRHPDTFEFADTLYEDLKRRDFTVNAMAIDAYTNRLVDPHHGLGDMALRILRCVGDPKERFNEDYLRILRFFRFVAQLGFDPDEAALEEIASNPRRVAGIVPERIREELIKIFKTQFPSRAFRLMYETGVLKEILPEVSQLYLVGQYHPKHMDDAFTHTLNVLDYATMLGADFLTQFAALFHDIGKFEVYEKSGDKISFNSHAQKGGEMALEIMSRLKFSNSDKEDIRFLVHNHMSLHQFDETMNAELSKYFRRMVAKKGEDQVRRLLTLSYADKLDTFNGSINMSKIRVLDGVIARLRESPPKLQINGFDIMKILGIKGKKVGAVKEMLEDLVIEEKIPNDEGYLKFLLEYSAELVKELAGVAASK
jgi:tRNA nucleotidyltransferase (CCA-adding enzyme)